MTTATFNTSGTANATGHEPSVQSHDSEATLAEEALIALAVRDYSYYSALAQAGLNPDWFATYETRTLWAALSKLYAAPALEVYRSGLEAELAKTATHNKQAQCVELLDRAIESDVPESYLEPHFNTLLTRYQKRLEKRAIKQWAGLLEDANLTSQERINRLEKELENIKLVAVPLTILHARDLARERREYYEQAMAGNADPTIPFRQRCLNQTTDGGVRPAGFTAWIGQPKSGKTSLLLADCIYQALYTEDDDGETKPQRVCAFVSLEMTRGQWVDRAIQQQLGISANKLSKGDLGRWQQEVFGQLDRLEGAPLYFLDAPGTTIEQIDRLFDHVTHKEGKLELAYIDYAQLVSVPGAKDELSAMQQISTSLKNLSKKYNCHIHCIARKNEDGRIHMGKQMTYDAHAVVDLKFEAPKPGHDGKIPDKWPILAHFGYQRFAASGVTTELMWHPRWTLHTDPSVVLQRTETRYGRDFWQS